METTKEKNYKQEIMQVLVNAPTNTLSSAAMKWAISNLPDSNKNGKFKSLGEEIKFNHKLSSTHDACGIFEDDLSNLNKEIHTIMEDAPEKFKKSEMIELFIKKGSEQLLLNFLIAGIIATIYQEEVSQMTSKKKDLGDLLKALSSDSSLADKIDIKIGQETDDATSFTSIESEEDIPESAPEHIKDLMRALIKTKKALKKRKKGGDDDSK